MIINGKYIPAATAATTTAEAVAAASTYARGRAFTLRSQFSHIY